MNVVRPTVEVFADICCPFTHLGLRRFVDRRAAAGRDDVVLRVRAWPLETVNGRPLDATFVADEVVELRAQVDPTSFARFDVASFPSSSMPAFALAASAYRRSVETGEAVSLELRDRLFERGEDVADPTVLAAVAARFDLETTDDDRASIERDHADGARRGVIGSPHFFTPAGGFFCPALDVSRDDRGHLRILADPDGFDRFIETCF